MLHQYRHYQLRTGPKKTSPTCNDSSNSDWVTIRPIFGGFGRLPIELQQKILALAVERQELVSPGKKIYTVNGK